jgi:hypothetical protein
VVTSRDLDQVARVRKAAVQFKADGHSIEYEEPRDLVFHLEQVKMSLIGAATSEYGGTYDMTTVDKLARVVVTIEYATTPERSAALRRASPS